MAEDLVNRHRLAAILGVDVRSVTNFAKEGMPRGARGRYDLGACVRWYVERERESARAGKGLNDLDLARQRKTVAEARLAEIELATAEGSVYTREAVERLALDLAEPLVARCNTLSRYIGDVQPAMSDVEAAALLDRIRDELLASFRTAPDDLMEPADADDARAAS